MTGQASRPWWSTVPLLAALLAAGCGASKPLPDDPDDDEPPKVAIALRAEEAPHDEETDTRDVSSMDLGAE
ncbi:MAG: hypothetical protein ACOCUS_07425, partial [Polyangiales bacterium]